MSIQFDNKIGWAAVIGLMGFPAMMITVGIAWGSLGGKVDLVNALAAAAAVKADEAKKATEETTRNASKRDQKVSEQGERIGKIETSVQFIVPALQRIESKLDAAPK